MGRKMEIKIDIDAPLTLEDEIYLIICEEVGFNESHGRFGDLEATKKIMELIARTAPKRKIG